MVYRYFKKKKNNDVSDIFERHSDIDHEKLINRLWVVIIIILIGLMIIS